MSGMLIVGAGQAGGTAALQLRASGYTGEITLAGSEPHAPYERPPLSKGYLSGALPYESLLVRPEETYEKQRIKLLTTTTIAAINSGAGTAKTAENDEITFEGLLLATGARPRQLPVSGAELPGVYYLRTIADVKQLQGALARAKRVCLIGGGVCRPRVCVGSSQSWIRGDCSRVCRPSPQACDHRDHEPIL